MRRKEWKAETGKKGKKRKRKSRERRNKIMKRKRGKLMGGK